MYNIYSEEHSELVENNPGVDEKYWVQCWDCGWEGFDTEAKECCPDCGSTKVEYADDIAESSGG